MSPSESQRESWHVVIVDDNADDRALLRRLLLRGADRHYHFIEAETAADGVRAIRSLQRAPDCVLLDYHLPDADACDVLMDCAGAGQQALCPVLVLTSSASREEVRAVLHAGAQDFLDKDSLTAQSLTRALENAVERFSLAAKIREREAVIRDSEARLRLALEASNTGLWTWDLPTDRVVWSPEVHDILGVPEGNFGGTGAEFFQLVHPEDRDRVGAVVREAIALGSLYQAEFRIVRPDGVTIWVENRGRARRSSGGEPSSMLGTVTDVTQRKDTEWRLRRRELELRTLTDNTPDILTRFDRELRHVYVNAAVEKATGQPREAFIGKTNRELGMPGQLCEQWEVALRAVFEGKGDQFITFCYDGPGGEQHYEARIVPELGVDGRIDQVLVVTHDVTERVRHEQAMEDAARRKDDFLAALAHELRNPLAPVRTGIEVLRMAGGSGDQLRTLAAMDRQVSHMVRLVDDLMDVSRIRRGALELKRERILLEAIVEQAVDACRAPIEANDHVLEVTLPEGPLWIDGDPSRLAQVLTNLLNNSAKYTPAKGHIRITAAADKGQVSLSIADDGVGISESDLPRIFDLFAQSAPARDRSQGGLGIGLSLVRQIVALHGGSVVAHSPGPGQGSVFTVSLPLAADAAPASAREGEAAESILLEREASQRVLVVDDNRDAAELLANVLSLAGNVTRVAHDGPEAIAAARAFSPHVILMDLELPGMDGCEVASQLRSEGTAGQAVLLIALTGWGGPEDKRRTAAAGFDLHMTKPVRMSAITDLLRSKVARGQETAKRA